MKYELKNTLIQYILVIFYIIVTDKFQLVTIFWKKILDMSLFENTFNLLSLRCSHFPQA